MFDTVAGKFEKGPYFPKDESRNSWETRTRKFFDTKLNSWETATSHAFNRPEARVAIYGDGAILRVEASLPKLLYGNNLATVCDAELPLKRLHEFVSDHVNGEIPELGLMDYLRVDYAYNFHVGQSLADYVSTLGKLSFLKHRRTTDSYGGVEWWNDNGRRIQAYDKHKEIWENDKKKVAEALGVLRFELQLRKKSKYLWPPSAGPLSLPALAMPPLEELLSEQIVLMPRAPSESPVFADCRDSSALPQKVA
jgi:hypothetical protein